MVHALEGSIAATVTLCMLFTDMLCVHMLLFSYTLIIYIYTNYGFKEKNPYQYATLRAESHIPNAKQTKYQ